MFSPLLPFVNPLPTPILSRSQVHISRATLEELEGAYEVEAADGEARSKYLKERGIDTFFIKQEQPKGKVSRGRDESAGL